MPNIPIGLFFNIRFFFPYNFEIDKNNFCYFRIKSLDPKKFSKIKFSLTAFSSYGGNKFQEVIELYDLESRPFEVTLPNIPPKGFIIDLLPLYDTLIIEIHELYDYNNLNLNQVSYKLKERYTIFHSEILNDEFLKCIGKKYGMWDLLNKLKPILSENMLGIYPTIVFFISTNPS